MHTATLCIALIQTALTMTSTYCIADAASRDYRAHRDEVVQVSCSFLFEFWETSRMKLKNMVP